MSARRLAVCVDDFGLHSGVDGAVLDLHDRGRITAVSCMVGGSSWKDSAPSLRLRAATTIDVGLHLDLTEHPFDASLRLPLREWIVRTFLRQADAGALRTEIRAQLDAFEDAMGRPPSHVDGHQHVHQFPVVRDCLVQLVRERRSAGPLPWLRSTRRADNAGVKARVIETLGRAGLSRLCARTGLAENSHLLGVYDFRGTADRYELLMAGWLASARDRDLLMCHPARHADPADPIRQARLNEYAVLSGAAFQDRVAQAGLQLLPLSAVLAEVPTAAEIAQARGGQ